MADNILERIPADVVALAKCALPPSPPTAMHVLIDVPSIGPVRIYFQWKEVRVHRNTSRFWSAYRAEREPSTDRTTDVGAALPP